MKDNAKVDAIGELIDRITIAGFSLERHPKPFVLIMC